MAADKDLKGISLGESAAVRDYYDGWTDSYEADVQSWGYSAPVVAAELLAERVDGSAQVLDAGCGTGLVGRALKAKGFHDVVGVDISSDSLDVAVTSQAYRALTEVDFTDLPTNLAEASFQAVVSVGVLSYLVDVEAVLREFSRITEASGTIIVSERTDLFEQRSTGAVFDALVADGTWEIVTVTEPRPYLPHLAQWESIQVRFGVFERQ